MGHRAFAALAAVVGLAAPAVALAGPVQTPVTSAKTKTPPTPSAIVNPNADEWALINLLATDVTSARGGAGVLVGLYDGLTDCTHPDLSGRCTDTKLPGGHYSGYDSHATHTAGIIAGSKFGVATSAAIANYGVFDSSHYIAFGNGLINAWNAAAARGATIASMSFGCAGTALCFTAAEDAAMASSSLSSTLFVKAAGNDNLYLKTESVAISAATAQTALSRVILVGSVDVHGVRSFFSNAPGDGCLLPSGARTCTPQTQWKYHFLVAPGEAIYSTLPRSSYGFMSGTSMATPVVAGAAALLEARWPTLKSQPAQVASILFQTATDLGAPGVDGVYGYGLLNVHRAFQNIGPTAVISPSGAAIPVDSQQVVTGTTMGPTATAIGEVTAYDSFGRDFKLSQVSNLRLAADPLALWAGSGARLANVLDQDEWTGRFFAASSSPTFWAGFGPEGAALSPGVALDRSLRLGVDAPMGSGSLHLRLTGQSNTRTDLAGDDALRPLSFFASSELLDQSALVSFSGPAWGAGRLVVFGAASLGAQIQPAFSGTYADMLRLRGQTADLALRVDRTAREQAGMGVGFWTRPDDRTVVGINASAFVQKHALYDMSTSLDAFDRPSRVFNLGLAASRAYGRWSVFGSAELTALDPPSSASPIQVTRATLVSGELGLRRTGVAFRGSGVHDALALSLVAPPHAVSGALRLDYLAPTDDGLGRQAIQRDERLSQLIDPALRLEGAYTVGRGRRWSYAVSGGVDLGGSRAVVTMSQLKLAF